MMEWVTHFGLYAVGFIVLVALWLFYEEISYRPAKPDAQGRVTVMPGPMSYLFGCVCFGFIVLFLSLAMNAVFWKGEDRLAWTIFGPLIILPLLYATYVIFWTRIRVSRCSVDIRGLGGWRSFDWDTVDGVRNRWWLGDRLHLLDGRPRAFWAYGFGHDAVSEAFDLNDKPYDTYA